MKNKKLKQGVGVVVKSFPNSGAETLPPFSPVFTLKVYMRIKWLWLTAEQKQGVC